MLATPANEIFSKVVLAVEQTVYLENNILSPATRLVDDLQLGRFGRIRLALYLEETFDVDISDDVVECFDTVGDIAQYMSRCSMNGTADAVMERWPEAARNSQLCE